MYRRKFINTHTNAVLAFPHKFIQQLLCITTLCAVSSDKVGGGNFNLVQLLKKFVFMTQLFAALKKQTWLFQSGLDGSAEFSSPGSNDSGNGSKLHQGRFRLDIRKHSFTNYSVFFPSNPRQGFYEQEPGLPSPSAVHHYSIHLLLHVKCFSNSLHKDWSFPVPRSSQCLSNKMITTSLFFFTKNESIFSAVKQLQQELMMYPLQNNQLAV